MQSSRADLDMNQHVNNLKYIDWVLEVLPYIIQLLCCYISLYPFVDLLIHALEGHFERPLAFIPMEITFGDMLKFVRND